LVEHLTEALAPRCDGILAIGLRQLPRAFHVACEETRVGRQGVVLQPGIELVRVDPGEGDESFRHAVLQELVVGDHGPVGRGDLTLIAEHFEQGAVLTGEVRSIGELAGSPMSARVDQRVQFEVLK
jgi:hypothetical protein